MLVLRFLIPATKTQDNRDPSDTGTLDLLHGGLLLGYARVSTEDQNLAIQRQKLTGAGCQRLFAEKITEAQRERPKLARLLDQLRSGDVVTVTRLDRLARSTRDLLDIAEKIQAAGAAWRGACRAVCTRRDGREWPACPSPRAPLP